MPTQILIDAYITHNSTTQQLKAGELISAQDPKSNVKALLAPRRYESVLSQLTSSGSLGDVVMSRRSWQCIYAINAR